MKKYLLICSLVLAFFSCKEANEVFDYYDSEYYVSTEIIVNEDGNEKYYEGPVYINASNWGSVAYISEPYVNKGIKLLISETDNAEGGKEYDVTSNAIVINDLSPNRRYYYCLYIPDGGIKSQIKNVVIPDASALNMTIELVNDSVVCTIQDSISSALIVEKGFCWGYYSDDNERSKYVVTGNRFACSKDEILNFFSTDGALVYAYVYTTNAYYCTRDGIDVSRDESSSSTDDNINTEDIVISAITEETINDVDYFKCTVTGYVDKAYFSGNIGDINADSVEVSDDNKTTTYYLKKKLPSNVQLLVYYRQYYSGDTINYRSLIATSEYYTPASYNIRSLDELIQYSQSFGYFGTINLLSDITIPQGMRLSIPLPKVAFNGNGHVIDGVSYFPLFRERNSTITIKNLIIGKDETVYNVKKGTSSLTTTEDEVPAYLLLNDYLVTFENCEVRGKIEVTGRNDFRILYEYDSTGFNESTGQEVIIGLKDYTITKYNN